MRALLIAGQYPPQIGGLARAAERYANHLSAKFNVTALNITEKLIAGRIEREQMNEDIEIFRIGASKKISDTLRFAATVIEDLHSERKFDLFAGFYLIFAGYLAAYCGRKLTRPSIVFARGNDLDVSAFTPEHLPFLQWTLKSAGAVCCVTRELVGQAEAIAFRNDVKYTPNGVDSEFWKPLQRDQQLTEELGLEGKIVLGFIGELRAKKAPGVLLDAFANVQANMPAKLLIIGGARTEERQRLNEFAKLHPRLGSEIRLIEYIDSAEELRRYMSLIDVALFPSLWEGMSNALLESMSMEKIVLASDAGGNREAVVDEKSGFLVPRSRLPEFGERLLSMLFLPRERLIETACAARLRVLREFTTDQERQTLFSVIDELIN